MAQGCAGCLIILIVVAALGACAAAAQAIALELPTIFQILVIGTVFVAAIWGVVAIVRSVMDYAATRKQ